MLGKPYNSDPADPYNCSAAKGDRILPVLLGNGFQKFFNRHRLDRDAFSLYTNGKLTYRGK